MKKRNFATLGMAVMLCTMLFACTKNPEVVVDYPIEPASDTDIVLEENSAELISTTYYDPSKLNMVYAESVNENICGMAKQLLIAIDKCEDKVDFTNYVVNANSVAQALALAKVSNPIAESVGLGTHEGDVYELEYIFEKDKLLDVRNKYVAEVDIALQNCVDSQKSDAEVAKALYKYVVEHFTLDVENEYRDVLNLDAEGDVDPTQGFSTMESVLNGKGNSFSMNTYYMGLLTQIGISSEMITSSGEKTYNGSSETLTKILDNPGQYYFGVIIFIADEPYICDLIFDGIVYYDQLKDYPDSECDVLFFGMSDETRKSLVLKSNLSAVTIQIQSGGGAGGMLSVPECPEDLQ